MAGLVDRLLSPLRPPIETARHYSLRKLRADVLAGLTVSVVEVPQAMAYALIAGVPPQYGIYTSIIQGIIGALLSSSEHLTTGPTNTQSLLVASAVTRLLSLQGAMPEAQRAEMYLNLVFALTMLKGIIQLAFAGAQMGGMVRYVSRSVIVGVAAGAGVLIAVGQLPNFLGLQVHNSGGDLPGVLGQVQRMAPHMSEVNGRAVVVGAVSLALVLGSAAIWRFLPGSLLAIVAGAAIVTVRHWSADDLPLVGELPRVLPSFHVPQVTWAQSEALLGGAAALAILGMLESVAIVKTIAVRTGERINPNQEFFAQGLKNFLSSFFQCIPGSGSFTRSMLDYAAGAATRFAAVFNALFVAVIYFAGAEAAGNIPLASLAAVLLVIAFRLVDFRHIARVLRTSKADAAVCLATLAATVLMPLEYAIFVGIFLNLALVLRQAGQLHMTQMVQGMGGGPFLEHPFDEQAPTGSVVFLQLEGDLSFSVADELEDRLRCVAAGGARVMILRLKRTHSIDVTVLEVLDRFVAQLQGRGGHALLCGVRPELMDKLRRFGLVDRIGQANVFAAGPGVFTSAKAALQRARELLGSSIDTAGLDLEEPETFAYEI